MLPFRVETFRALDVTAGASLAGIEGRYFPSARFEHGAMAYRQDFEGGSHSLVWDVAMSSGSDLPLGGLVFWGNVSCHWQIRADSGDIVAQLGPNCRRLTPQQLAFTQRRKRPKWKAPDKKRRAKAGEGGEDMVFDRSIVVTPEGDPTGSYWLMPQPAVLGFHAVVYYYFTNKTLTD